MIIIIIITKVSRTHTHTHTATIYDKARASGDLLGLVDHHFQK